MAASHSGLSDPNFDLDLLLYLCSFLSVLPCIINPSPNCSLIDNR